MNQRIKYFIFIYLFAVLPINRTEKIYRKFIHSIMHILNMIFCNWYLKVLLLMYFIWNKLKTYCYCFFYVEHTVRQTIKWKKLIFHSTQNVKQTLTCFLVQFTSLNIKYTDKHGLDLLISPGLQWKHLLSFSKKISFSVRCYLRGNSAAVLW